MAMPGIGGGAGMADRQDPFSVLIAASNEEAWIGRCLEALLAQDRAAGRLEILVSANVCSDRTTDIVRRLVPRAEARGWRLDCLDSPEPGKARALNRGEAHLSGGLRAYLDADVICDPSMFGQLRAALDRPGAAYATGTLVVAPAKSWVTRRYAALWTRLPFVTGGAVGAGLFAVNAAGRARWEAFPEIISDDTFVRLQFAPGERHEVAARYHWPMVEGWRNLVRVRRRQDAGVAEVYRLWPALAGNEAKARLGGRGLLRLAAAVPVGLAIYSAVALEVRLRPAERNWRRGQR